MYVPRLLKAEETAVPDRKHLWAEPLLEKEAAENPAKLIHHLSKVSRSCP
jgi:hypothetical protein